MRGDRGASTVELAFVAPLLFVLALGIVDFGRALSYKIAISDAAQEGLSYASYEPDDPTGTVQRVLFSTTDPKLDAGNVSVTCLTEPGDHVAVKVDYEIELLTPFIGEMFGGTVPISSTAVGETFTEAPCVDS